ncbi:2-phosphosulfolactate phosphatase [Aquibacillus halophilus]|uniref:Probable 2-phosphosulfolactate phosphatase n=1 Tax=Aquibacillus halophilus TaxID=930132 RepID=A0A6A8DH72_9BACI|nr:2-phosphosulfolactate phosphatase [Aquibacillus halophilus]MRH43846.1 2-phosphosulfolactate phosphatase [Aquibacillus halophilus]
MKINIYQGRTVPPTVADTTIVIDVIRAFTVAHYAFLQGVSRILLAETVEQAFQIKKEHPEYLLAGEVAGLAIKGFDLDNSPYHIQEKNLTGKVLVQKTTNGVRATLNCLKSDSVFVTGFTNARNTAEFVKERITGEEETINIIASHPSGDDDLACAEYIKSLIEDSSSISAREVVDRIKQSHVAAKFYDRENKAFQYEDIFQCIRELNTDFVMKVDHASKIPTIERVQYDGNRFNFANKGSETKTKRINSSY